MLSVTVLCAVYNGEKHLFKTIESILNQDYTDLRVLIVDDGSTDSTLTIIKELKQNDHRVSWVHQENKGLTQALIHGMSKCNSDLIARIDCGDLSRPKRISTQVKAFKDNPNLVLCGTETQLIDLSGAVCGHQTFSGKIRNALLSRNPLTHSSCMFSKTAYDKSGGYRPEFKCSQDYDLWTRMALLGDINIIRKPLTLSLIDPKGISSTKMDLQVKMGAQISLEYSRSIDLELPQDLPLYHFTLMISPKRAHEVPRSRAFSLFIQKPYFITSLNFEHLIKWSIFVTLGSKFLSVLHHHFKKKAFRF